jgi:hypothetical protein
VEPEIDHDKEGNLRVTFEDQIGRFHVTIELEKKGAGVVRYGDETKEFLVDQHGVRLKDDSRVEEDDDGTLTDRDQWGASIYDETGYFEVFSGGYSLAEAVENFAGDLVKQLFSAARQGVEELAVARAKGVFTA